MVAATGGSQSSHCRTLVRMGWAPGQEDSDSPGTAGETLQLSVGPPFPPQCPSGPVSASSALGLPHPSPLPQGSCPTVSGLLVSVIHAQPLRNEE